MSVLRDRARDIDALNPITVHTVECDSQTYDRPREEPCEACTLYAPGTLHRVLEDEGVADGEPAWIEGLVEVIVASGWLARVRADAHAEGRREGWDDGYLAARAPVPEPGPGVDPVLRLAQTEQAISAHEARVRALRKLRTRLRRQTRTAAAS